MTQRVNQYEPEYSQDHYLVGYTISDLQRDQWVLLEVRRQDNRFVVWVSQGGELITSAISLESLNDLKTSTGAELVREEIRKMLGDNLETALDEMVVFLHNHQAELYQDNPDSDDEEDETNPTLRLIHIANQLNYVIEERGDVYAMVNVRSDDFQSYHRETYPVNSSSFRKWLRRQYYVRFHRGVGSEVLKNAIETIEASVVYRPRNQRVHLWNRVALDADGSFWYDLCDNEWKAIKITDKGWEIVERPPALFTRYPHQKTQVMPVDPKKGDMNLLLPLINVQETDAQTVIKVWAVASLIPDIPHPILDVEGAHGSCKSTLMRFLRELVDPSAMNLLSFNYKGDETALMLQNHYCAFFDNVSKMPEWLSDSLCRAVTGDGFTKRKLYTDDESVIFKFKRVIGLDGIAPAIHKPDLLDRTIHIRLKRVLEKHRREEQDIETKFRESKAIIFTGMLNALCDAIYHYPKVELKALPRMADFARWGEAISRALGYPDYHFITIYSRWIGDQNMNALEQNPVGLAVLELMSGRMEFEGTPLELYDALIEIAKKRSIDTNTKLFPQNTAWLTRRLRQVEANLLEEGIVLHLDRTSTERIIKITKEDPEGYSGNAVISVMPSSSKVEEPEPSNSMTASMTASQNNDSIPSSMLSFRNQFKSSPEPKKEKDDSMTAMTAKMQLKGGVNPIPIKVGHEETPMTMEERMGALMGLLAYHGELTKTELTVRLENNQPNYPLDHLGDDLQFLRERGDIIQDVDGVMRKT